MLISDPATTITKKLTLYKIAVLILVFTIIIIGYQYQRLSQEVRPNPKSPDLMMPNAKDTPYYSLITEIIGKLEYSGIQAITRGDVTLSIDFTNKNGPSTTFTNMMPRVILF